jgi:hypothetical protein
MASSPLPAAAEAPIPFPLPPASTPILMRSAAEPRYPPQAAPPHAMLPSAPPGPSLEISPGPLPALRTESAAGGAPAFPAHWLPGSAAAASPPTDQPATGQASVPPLLDRLRRQETAPVRTPQLLAQLGQPSPASGPRPAAPAGLPPLLAALPSIHAPAQGSAGQQPAPPLADLFRNMGQPEAPAPAKPTSDVLRALRLQGRS